MLAKCNMQLALGWGVSWLSRMEMGLGIGDVYNRFNWFLGLSIRGCV